MPKDIMTKDVTIHKVVVPKKEIRLNESQAIQTILGHPPSWILRYGIGIVAIFVIVLAVMS